MKKMAGQLRAIFFDVGNTLLFPDRETILKSLYRRNIQPTLEQWQAIERATKRSFDDLMQHNGAVDHGFWRMFYGSLLREVKSEDDHLRDELVEATRHSANWRLIRPGTREILQKLGQRYALAVISNADGKIIEVLKRCGIADCFRSITDSGLVGYEKPHPAIFEAAVRDMRTTPEESLYVGDVYSVDYLGATRAGMQAILFDVAGAYRATGWPRVESLEELEAKLAEQRQ
jgi:putative hydrolase of the HAD superfamily